MFLYHAFFVCCCLEKIIIAIALEKLNGDLLQPSGIRYDSISLNVIFAYYSCILGKIDFWFQSVCCGTPKP